MPMLIKSRPIIPVLVIGILFIVYLFSHASSPGLTRITSPGTHSNVSVHTVVAQIRSENATWLYRLLPDWNHNVYVVDDPRALLTVPMNKGRESMVYLTYIIDRYENLPEFVIFLHSERWQWHNDDPDYDGYAVLRRLQFQHIKKEGYVSLRCAWDLGCPYEIRPYGDLSTTEESKTHHRAYKKAFEDLFPGKEIPKTVGSPCCAQFVVTGAKLRERPRSDYIKYREWLIGTKLEDEVSGRMFEYSWHMIFGKPPQHCPLAKNCYCKLFGLCGLQCTEGMCEGRYERPKYSALPQGWPQVDWLGRPRVYNGPP